jgi:hypothetical protein
MPTTLLAINLLLCRTLISAIGALRDALLSTNADPERAAKAAEEAIGYEKSARRYAL